MKTPIKYILLILLLATIGYGGYFYYKNFRGIGAALNKPSQDITKLIASGKSPLKFPKGFSVEVFAKSLPGARVMIIDHEGNMWVSQSKEGEISRIQIKGGKNVGQEVIFKGLSNPHGLAIDPSDINVLYIAESNKISKTLIDLQPLPQKMITLPVGGTHNTRTIGYGPDNQLYLSIGSSCNACYEKDQNRAKILTVNLTDQRLTEYAKGLRNSVFFTWSPFDKKMIATEMGRDFLGDDLPPDEINIIEKGNDYGWPTCYGKNIYDATFDKSVNPGFCKDKSPSLIDLPAHSAPLGLAYLPATANWPKEYSQNLFVAYHGSWNKSEPDGYKVVRFIFDENGKNIGTQDFISGWLKGNESLGRPVGILIDKNGVMYISDDKVGVIYKVTYREGE